MIAPLTLDCLRKAKDSLEGWEFKRPRYYLRNGFEVSVEDFMINGGEINQQIMADELGFSDFNK